MGKDDKPFPLSDEARRYMAIQNGFVNLLRYTPYQQTIDDTISILNRIWRGLSWDEKHYLEGRSPSTTPRVSDEPPQRRDSSINVMLQSASARISGDFLLLQKWWECWPQLHHTIKSITDGWVNETETRDHSLTIWDKDDRHKLFCEARVEEDENGTWTWWMSGGPNGDIAEGATNSLELAKQAVEVMLHTWQLAEVSRDEHQDKA